VDDTTLTTTSRSVSSLALNTTYYWRVRSKNAAGYSAYSAARSFKTIRTTAVEKLDGSIPSDYALSQNYPNPFNPTTTIRYDIPANGWVTLKVYDILGREVATLVNGMESPGYKEVNFNANKLPSGIYFYRLTAGTFTETRKLVLMK